MNTPDANTVKTFLHNRTEETFAAELKKEFRGIPYRYILPESTVESLSRYLFHGVPPGSFLCAVLRNDLREALGRADEFNTPALPWIVAFLVNYFPAGIWGDSERMMFWKMAHDLSLVSRRENA